MLMTSRAPYRCQIMVRRGWHSRATTNNSNSYCIGRCLNRIFRARIQQLEVEAAENASRLAASESRAATGRRTEQEACLAKISQGERRHQVNARCTVRCVQNLLLEYCAHTIQCATRFLERTKAKLYIRSTAVVGTMLAMIPLY